MSTRQTIQIILDRINIAKAYRAEFGADDLDIYNSETITICEWSRMLWGLIEEAHSEALSEDLWRCDSAGNVLPVAASYRRRASQQAVADAWNTGSTFALMDALQAIQSPSKVSLVKSPKVSLVKSYVGTLGYLQHIGHDLSSFEY